MHFEINKGDFGRPIYPFGQCSEAKKSGIETINNGLCREQMFKYGQDPIAFLEDAKAKRPFDDHPREVPLPDNKTYGSTGVDTGSTLEHNVAPIVPSPAPSSPVISVPVQANQEKPQTSKLIIDTSALDNNGKAFFDEWSVDLTGDVASPIKKNQTRILTLTIKNKKT